MKSRQPSTARLGLRMEPQDLATMRDRASKSGLSLSEWVRRRCLLDNRRPQIIVDDAQLKEIYVLTRRSCGLLNQACRNMHFRTRPEELEADMQRAIRAVAQASEDISKFLADARNSI